MERFVNKIYKDLCFYNPLFNILDKEDMKQEIRFAIITAEQDFIYKVAARLCYNLATDYGFSRKKGKDNFTAFYQQPEFTETELQLLSDIEKYYQIEDHTGKETAEKFNFKYDNKTAKLLAACYPKNKSNRLKSKKIEL